MGCACQKYLGYQSQPAPYRHVVAIVIISYIRRQSKRIVLLVRNMKNYNGIKNINKSNKIKKKFIKNKYKSRSNQTMPIFPFSEIPKPSTTTTTTPTPLTSPYSFQAPLPITTTSMTYPAKGNIKTLQIFTGFYYYYPVIMIFVFFPLRMLCNQFREF